VKWPAVVITPEFIEELPRTGPLARAMERARLGTAQPRNQANWPAISTWHLVCEEILDTTHDDWWLDDILAELGRRGFSDDQIHCLRTLAWATVGWLNWELMLWEWCTLGEDDIRRALRLQLERGLISRPFYDQCLHLVEHPELCTG